MSVTDAAVHKPSPVLQSDDPSRGRRLVKVGAWLAGTAAVILLLQLLGDPWCERGGASLPAG